MMYHVHVVYVAIFRSVGRYTYLVPGYRVVGMVGTISTQQLFYVAVCVASSR